MRTGVKWAAVVLVAGVALGAWALARQAWVRPHVPRPAVGPVRAPTPTPAPTDAEPGWRKAHVFVALCDNANQGIVPVPAAIGNGRDPDRNLYWGTDCGLRTFFAKHSEWKLLSKQKNPKPYVLERLVYRHKHRKALLVADAYDGAYMADTIAAMLNASAGVGREAVKVEGKTFQFAGGADLAAFIGHNGLMEMSLDAYPKAADTKRRDAIVLSCQSRPYFAPLLKRAGARPILLTNQLMCPEAYTLVAALEGWLRDEPSHAIVERAAQAYNKYQKCGIRGARRLFAETATP